MSFFNEYLFKISELEGAKEVRERQLQELNLQKEQLFLTKYDLERKLAEMSSALQNAEDHKREVAAQNKALQKKYDAKVSECESMLFRIKHLDEMQGMLDPP